MEKDAFPQIMLSYKIYQQVWLPELTSQNLILIWGLCLFEWNFAPGPTNKGEDQKNIYIFWCLTLNVQQVKHANLSKLFMKSEDNIFMSSWNLCVVKIT